MTAPTPKVRTQPVWAIVKIGVRTFKARILWSEYDSRKPDIFTVLGPKDARIQCRRANITFIAD